MKVASLFAGIGGFDLALTRLGHEIVYANEWDKHAALIYEKNFNRKPDTRDITTVPTGDIPDHDLLVGGFPCQAFSIAGKRKGFSDTRGTLFFEIARILRSHKPRFLLLENVKGLLSHANGDTFKTIITTLTELGYDLQWQMLNSRDFGALQSRERIYIVGHLRGEPRPQIFPITDRVRQNRLPDNVFAWSKSHRTGTSPADYKRKNRGKTEMRIRYGIASTLTTGRGSASQSASNFVINSDGLIRVLTPLECERLQGYPDGWTIGVSDSQRYKQLGNAVTVNVVEAIASKL